jgi:hypothetical protein
MSGPEGFSNKNTDSRTPGEVAEDLADEQLLQFYMDIGFFEQADDSVFTKEELLSYIRASWINGVCYAIENQHESINWLRNANEQVDSAGAALKNKSDSTESD